MNLSKTATGAQLPLRALRSFPADTRLTDAQAWAMRRGYRIAMGRDGLKAVALTVVKGPSA